MTEIGEQIGLVFRAAGADGYLHAREVGQRLAVVGYSYGGFMTCYLTSRDHRFAAAVAGGVLSDLSSMAGTSDMGHYISEWELGGRPWDHRERYEAMSPFSRIDAVTTPTLVVHGLDDLRCPVGQGQQWHTALRERGVPTRLTLYPGGTHLFIFDGQPSHRLDYQRRVVDWVEQYAGPRPARIDAAHWQRRLDALAARHQVPGAVLGMLRIQPGVPDDQVEAAYGVLSTATEVPVTRDSVFQIGSISKVWTTTVVMQLVDEGLLDLDAPIVDVLPELTLADADVAKRVTMRQLLTHTSGIDGDVFTDTGRGDDCLERYVDQLDQVGQLYPLGAMFSYCNTGFNLAGRVIEKLTGQSWDQAMRDRLFTPLGLQHTVTLPEEALLFRAAVGHTAAADSRPAPVATWGLPRSVGPAGLITSSVADVLSFARLHLIGGRAPDGTQVLAPTTAAHMTELQTTLPVTHSLGDSWGLGWIRFGWDSQRLIGHDGNTIGQSAYLRILPEQGLAVTLLTNGGSANDLYEDLFRELFADVAGVAMPHPLAPPTKPVQVDLQRHSGRYERAGTVMEVLESDGALLLRHTPTGPGAESEPTLEFELTAADASGDLFLMRRPHWRTWTPVTFHRPATGERFVNIGVRSTPKVD